VGTQTKTKDLNKTTNKFPFIPSNYQETALRAPTRKRVASLHSDWMQPSRCTLCWFSYLLLNIQAGEVFVTQPRLFLVDSYMFQVLCIVLCINII